MAQVTGWVPGFAPEPEHSEHWMEVCEAAGALETAAAHAALLERGVSETVVGGPLLRVLQRLVGFVDFLELVLARGIARIAVRVELHGELAERALQFLLVRALLDAERLVEIGFHLAPRSSFLRESMSVMRFPI